MEENLITELSNNRVLTMSNNRKCDYLIIDIGIVENKCSPIVMGIKDNNNTVDIVFIKEEIKIDKDFIIPYITNICNEFDIHTIINDKLGYGIWLNDLWNAKEKSNNTIELKTINFRSILDRSASTVQLLEDIKNGKLRLLQTYNNAKLSYRKPFLGYSEVMNYHRETDKLMKEIKNIDLKTNATGSVVLQSEYIILRFSLILKYYNYKCNLEKGYTCNLTKNETINKLLDKPLGFTYQIENDTDFYSAIKSSLKAFLPNNYIFDSENDLEERTPHVLRWDRRESIRTMLCDLLSFSGGYTGKIIDNKLVIRPDSSKLIRD